MTQSEGILSALVKKTSLGISLIVEVIGAIVTPLKYSNIESRVRIKTGLFLSGALNLYHLISPLFICPPIPVLLPKR